MITIVPFIIFIGCIFISRMISSNAFQKLDSEKKLEAINMATQKRTITSIISFVAIAFLMLNTELRVIDLSLSFILFFSLLLLFIAFKTYRGIQKLKEHNFPKPYIKSYILASCIIILGTLSLFGMMFS